MTTKIIGSGLGDGAKALSVDQFFQYLEGLTDDPTKTAIYKSVSWVYRCVELRANNLAAIPYKVMRGETEQEEYPIDFTDLFWSLEADLCLFGAGYWLRDKPRTATTELQRLNPQTMEVKTDKRDPTKGITGFLQSVSGKTKLYKPEEIIYFRLYNPDNDLGPGTSPAEVVLEPAGLGKNANVWASNFFKHGAIPATVLETEQNIRDDELERVRGAFERLTKGVARAWRTVILRRGLKHTVIQPPVGELALAELKEWVRSEIAVAFGVPQTMLSDAANYATAGEHRLGFYQDTIIPRGVQLQRALNEQMFDELGLEFVFQFGDIEALQKDEAEKAEYLRHLVEAKIITKDEARDLLGFEEMTPDQEEELKPAMPDFAPGGDDGQGDDEQGPPPPPARALSVAMVTDLEKWKRKALAKGPMVPFESEFLPPEIADGIRAALSDATSDEEVKAAFAANFRDTYWQAYP